LPSKPFITIATQEAAPSTTLGLPQREIQRAYHKHRDNELTQLMLARNMLRDAALTAALTLRALRLKDRDDPITQLVAEKIIAIGRTGIENPAEISNLALKELGLP
jgi:hypothetical protein